MHWQFCFQLIWLRLNERAYFVWMAIGVWRTNRVRIVDTCTCSFVYSYIMSIWYLISCWLFSELFVCRREFFLALWNGARMPLDANGVKSSCELNFSNLMRMRMRINGRSSLLQITCDLFQLNLQPCEANKSLALRTHYTHIVLI